MQTIYTLLFLSLFLQAQSLQDVIEYSIKNNYQLQILQEEFEIINQQANIEATWDDPILKVGVNNIQINQPLNRNIEAMQNQFIALSQTIPLSNRVEISSKIEKKRQNIIIDKENILKVDIAFNIRKSFIEAKFARENLRILDDYIAFLKQPMDLITHLASVEKNSIEQYIKTELLQLDYKMQRESSIEKIEIAKEQIELIGNLKVDDFSDEVELKDYHQQPLDDLLYKIEEQNPKLKMIKDLQEIANIDIALAKAKEEADITLTGGYYQRANRDDYFSFSISYPLFINKKQYREKIKAIKRADIQDISYIKSRVELEQRLKIYLHQLKALYRELDILSQSKNSIYKLIDNAKANMALGGSLLHYYELYTKKSYTELSINEKERLVALIENKITQLLGDI